MNNWRPWILSTMIYPAAQEIQGRRYFKKMGEAYRVQYFEPQIIKAIQFNKVKALIDHAYNTVPYYRKLFESSGFKPEDIRGWNDYQKIPILSKEEIRNNFQQFVSNSPRSKVKPFRTSGSTGVPLTFYSSQTTLGVSNISRIRSLKWWGINLGDREIRFWGTYFLIRTGWKNEFERLISITLKDWIMNRKNLLGSKMDFSDQALEKYWRTINQFKPKYILGASSYFYQFAQFLNRRGYDATALKLAAIVSSAELLYDWQQKLIEDVFECPIANEYGSSETGVIAYGHPCGRMHTMDDFLLVEIIKTHPENEFGEVVVTHLENWDSPLIRYNLEDLAVPSNNSCSCPVGFSIIEKLIGRKNDLFKLPDGRIVYGYQLSKIVNQYEGIRQYQIIQKEVNFIEILAVVDENNFSIEDEDSIKKEIIRIYGDIRVEIRKVPFFSQESLNKFRWVRSEVELKRL